MKPLQFGKRPNANAPAKRGRPRGETKRTRGFSINIELLQNVEQHCALQCRSTSGLVEYLLNAYMAAPSDVEQMLLPFVSAAQIWNKV